LTGGRRTLGRKKNTREEEDRRPLIGDGDDATSRVIANGGEARTSPEMEAAWLSAVSPMKARKIP
jgi:hypothetical protein